jgi:dolichol kinase
MLPTETEPVAAQKRPLRPWLQELVRKSVHIAVSLNAVAIAWLAPDWIARVLFCSAAIVALTVDTLRLRSQTFRALFMSIFAPLLRSHETNRITGATTLAVGVAIVVLLFPKNFAIAGLLYAGLGDAAGALVGRSFGRHRFRSGKSLEGSIAFFCVTFLAGWAIPGIGALPAFAAAAIVTPIEAAPMRFDDNLVLPIFGASAMWIAVMLLG